MHNASVLLGEAMFSHNSPKHTLGGLAVLCVEIELECVCHSYPYVVSHRLDVYPPSPYGRCLWLQPPFTVLLVLTTMDGWMDAVTLLKY